MLRAFFLGLALLVISACADLKVVRYDPLLDDRENIAEQLESSEVHLDDDDRRKTLAVFFDGTANNYRTQTNVRRLFEIVGTRGDPDTVLYYAEGVGGYFERMLGNPVNLGAILGYGTSKDVREAYQFMSENYRAGGEAGRRIGESDKVAMFGFSRGAYAARAVAGMMELFGGVPDFTPCYVYENKKERSERVYVRKGTALRCEQSMVLRTAREREQVVEELYDLYRNLGRACKDKSSNFDADNTVSSIKDPEDGVLCQRLRKDVESTKAKYKMRFVEVNFLGIWDTVRTLGAEAFCMFGGKRDPKVAHSFHREFLTANVKVARHALSLDEKRQCLDLVLLQQEIGQTQKEDASELDTVRLKEVWFAGDHSDVGGGYSEHKSLAGLSLQWMLGEMKALDLFKPSPLSPEVYGDPYAPIHDLSEMPIFHSNESRAHILTRLWEKGPYPIRIHWSLACRIVQDRSATWPAYRPESWPFSLEISPGQSLQYFATGAYEPDGVGPLQEGRRRISIEWGTMKDRHCPPLQAKSKAPE